MPNIKLIDIIFVNFSKEKNKILYIILNYENIEEKYIRQFLIVKNKERITYKIHNSKIYAYSG